METVCNLPGLHHCVFYLALCRVFLGKFFDVYESRFPHPQIGAELHYQLLLCFHRLVSPGCQMLGGHCGDQDGQKSLLSGHWPPIGGTTGDEQVIVLTRGSFQALPHAREVTQP